MASSEGFSTVLTNQILDGRTAPTSWSRLSETQASCVIGIHLSTGAI